MLMTLLSKWVPSGDAAGNIAFKKTDVIHSECLGIAGGFSVILACVRGKCFQFGSEFDCGESIFHVHLFKSRFLFGFCYC